jgi:hypothetical protein
VRPRADHAAAGTPRPAAAITNGEANRRMNVSDENENPTEVTVGQCAWTDATDHEDQTLAINGIECRQGHTLDAAELRQLSLDLMKLANLVANRR